jgi:hypothetical protein
MLHTRLTPERNPRLIVPHGRIHNNKAVSAGLFEVRAKGRDGIGRAFYCTRVDERIGRNVAAVVLGSTVGTRRVGRARRSAFGLEEAKAGGQYLTDNRVSTTAELSPGAMPLEASESSHRDLWWMTRGR